MTTPGQPDPKHGSRSKMTAQEIIDQYNARTMSYSEEIDLKLKALSKRFDSLNKAAARQLQTLSKQYAGLDSGSDESPSPETWDSAGTCAEKLDRLAEMVREAKGAVVIFTGAGLSTAAGIPDYRSPIDTKLATGPGVWTKKEAAERAEYAGESSSLQAMPAIGTNARPNESRDASGSTAQESSSKKTGTAVTPAAARDAANMLTSDTRPSLANAAPTTAHYAIEALRRAGFVNHVASQNIDGLHRKAGTPASALSELHGNVFVERCHECGAEYERSFLVQHKTLAEVGQPGKIDSLACHRCNGKYPKDCHCTARTCNCSDCGGRLHDTIVKFGETLNKAVYSSATAAAERSRLCIVVGSSCKVHPASEIPITPDATAIINLQATAIDRYCTRNNGPARIGATANTALLGLCDRLGVAVPNVSSSDVVSE